MRISDLEFRRVLFRSDRQGRESVVHVQGRLESNFGEVVRDAAVAGLGIARHSTWHVCEDLRAGRLQVVLPDHSIADSGIYAVMPQRRLVPPRVRAFTEFLAGKFGENPPWERALAKSRASLRPPLSGAPSSDERRVGTECVRPWRSRWAPDH